MRLIKVALLYLAVATSANAETSAMDYGPVEALREGDMRKLNFHTTPEPVSELPFFLPDESEHRMEKYKGKYVLLNFWATWCAPCREEMPMLAELQTEFQGDSFEVVTIATGRNKVAGMARFMESIGVDNLPLYRDPKQQMAREMGVLGLPITVLIDPDGQEIARLRGDADWASDSAKAIITHVSEMHAAQSQAAN